MILLRFGVPVHSAYAILWCFLKHMKQNTHIDKNILHDYSIMHINFLKNGKNVNSTSGLEIPS